MVAAVSFPPAPLGPPAMPFRGPSPADPAPPDDIPSEILCCRKSDTNTCKCSLIVSCAVDSPQCCWERRQHGRCGCKYRDLPVCLLTSAHGCPTWCEGHPCSCKRQEMPCCMVTGCADRRAGRRCDCPRRPVQTCQHVQAKIERYASLTAAEAARLGNRWAEHLWASQTEEYADRALATRGVKTETAAEAVFLMEIREGLGLSLWHPNDDRGEDSIRRLKRQADGLKRLLGIVQKGSAA